MMCHTASDMGSHSFAMGGHQQRAYSEIRAFHPARGAHAGSLRRTWASTRLTRPISRLQAINANRELYREHDTVRIHGIMTKGGEAVNAVPADVRLEWRVRSGNAGGSGAEFRHR